MEEKVEEAMKEKQEQREVEEKQVDHSKSRNSARASRRFQQAAEWFQPRDSSTFGFLIFKPQVEYLPPLKLFRIDQLLPGLTFKLPPLQLQFSKRVFENLWDFEFIFGDLKEEDAFWQAQNWI